LWVNLLVKIYPSKKIKGMGIFCWPDGISKYRLNHNQN
jgi:hypothetical protein